MIGDNAQSRDILSVLILAPVHTGEKLNIGVVHRVVVCVVHCVAHKVHRVMGRHR